MENFSSITRTETYAKILPLGARRERQEAIWESLNTQRKSGQFCDVVIQCKGGTLHAHKSVLVSLGSYFRTLFTTEMSEKAQCPLVVDFKDFPIEALTSVLDVLYSSEDVSTDRLMDMLRFSDYIQDNWLQDLLVEHVSSFIKVDNVLDWYHLSKQFHIHKLTPLTQHCIRENHRILWWRAWASSINIDPIIKSAFQQDLPTKEVVIMSKGINIYIVDPEAGECYPCTHPDLLRLWSSSLYVKIGKKEWTKTTRSIDTTFTHQKVFYIVCQEYERLKRGLTILKYHHCQKVFEPAYFLDFAKIYEATSGTRDNTFLAVTTYDGYGALYTEFHNVDTCDMHFFKFDLTSGTLYDGFMTFIEGADPGSTLLPGKPAYLVGRNYVVNLDNFDFQSAEDHTPVKEYINPDDFIPDTAELTGEMMEEICKKHYVTAKGFYWIYCHYDLDEPRGYVILKLDVANCCWVPFCTFDGNLIYCFVCNDLLYFVCVNTYSKPMALKKVLRLNEDKAKVETTKLHPPVFQDCKVIPHHVL